MTFNATRPTVDDVRVLDEALTLPIFWTNRIIAIVPERRGWTRFLGQDLRGMWRTSRSARTSARRAQPMALVDRAA